MLVRSAAVMFDSWDAMKAYPSCIDSVATTDDAQLAHAKYIDCKDSLYKITGTQIKGGQTYNTSRQFWTALLEPIANLFFWAIIFLLGIVFYRTGNIVIPIEQSIREVGEEHKKK